jgi:adenylosuccinate synthase
MQNLAVIGAQWGDEGKGKIVDLLCETFDVVARYQGGHNAGHTVKFGEKHFALRLIPSGILHPDKLCILGNGMVIDPEALLDEIEKLRALGVVIDTNLKISDSAQVIFPYHKALDMAREEAAGEARIGTTGREPLRHPRLRPARSRRSARPHRVRVRGKESRPEGLRQGRLRPAEALRRLHAIRRGAGRPHHERHAADQ